MAPININYDEVTFNTGDLVKFIGFNYTPDYYVSEDDYDMLGIVVGEVKSAGPYITSAWLYKVYWFKTKKVTEVVAGHLKSVYINTTD